VNPALRFLLLLILLLGLPLVARPLLSEDGSVWDGNLLVIYHAARVVGVLARPRVGVFLLFILSILLSLVLVEIYLDLVHTSLCRSAVWLEWVRRLDSSSSEETQL
jgi:hypothetical protein